MPGGGSRLVHVCSDLSDAEMRNREIRALEAQRVA